MKIKKIVKEITKKKNNKKKMINKMMMMMIISMMKLKKIMKFNKLNNKISKYSLMKKKNKKIIDY